jgi:hypothetical protein
LAYENVILTDEPDIFGASDRGKIVLKPMLFLITLCLLSCGLPEQVKTPINSEIPSIPLKSETNANDVKNQTIEDTVGLKTCNHEFAPIYSIFNGYFSVHSSHSPYFTNSITNYTEQDNFTDRLANMTFTEHDKCQQLHASFSGDFGYQTSLGLKLEKNIVQELNRTSRSLKAKKFFSSYLSITNSFLPDNISRLPDHFFKVDVECPAGVKVSCYPEEMKCEPGQLIKAQFPEEPCTIKGSNQVFAIYPQGQVKINFEGTISEPKLLDDSTTQLTIKFSRVEWQ